MKTISVKKLKDFINEEIKELKDSAKDCTQPEAKRHFTDRIQPYKNVLDFIKKES